MNVWDFGTLLIVKRILTITPVSLPVMPNNQQITPMRKIVKTTRPLSSYSPMYLKYRGDILSYRERNKERIREYMQGYMTRWRCSEKGQALYDRLALRSYLTYVPVGKRRSKVHTRRRITRAQHMLGISAEEFAKKYGMSEQRFAKFVGTKTIDHIVSRKFIQDNYPHLLPYASRWYNIQFITRNRNSVKGAWVDAGSQDTQNIIKNMQVEHDIKEGKK